MPRTTLAVAIALLTAAAAPGPLTAQAHAQRSPSAEAPGVRLSGTPLRITSIGLTMHVPEGSVSQTSSFGTTTATRVENPDGSGVITVQARQSNDDQLSPKQVGDGIIETFLTTHGGRKGAAGQIAKSRARVLSRNSALVVGDQEMDRFYIEIPPKRASDPAPIHGYTIASPQPGRIVIFELVTDVNREGAARRAYETAVATALFEDPGDQAIRRASAVRAGVRLLEGLSEADYRDVFNSYGTRWERLFTPHENGADSDAAEHGYRRIKAWVGQRGELNPGRNKSRWNQLDQQHGYLLQVDALLLEPLLRVDTQAVYFVSLDKMEEAWTVRMSIRQGDQTSKWVETGARSDHSMTVSTAHGSAAPTVVRPLIQGEGYISMVESYMLGPLLVRAGVPADFAFYTYQSREGSIGMRTDTAERLGPGSWRVTSKLDETLPAQISEWSAEGEPVRTRLADGRVWEPTSYNQLVRLWRDKGLPLE